MLAGLIRKSVGARGAMVPWCSVPNFLKDALPRNFLLRRELRNFLSLCRILRIKND